MALKMKGKPLSKARMAQRAEEMTAMKKDIQSKMNKANKRIKRLENKGMHKTGAYQTHIEGKGRFGTRGKDYMELRYEQQRIDKFLESKTSTVKGVQAHNIQMLNKFGLEPTKENQNWMMEHANEVWELTHKMMEYQRIATNEAEAYNSNQMAEEVGQQQELGELDLTDLEGNLPKIMESMNNRMTKALESTAEYKEASEMESLFSAVRARKAKKLAKKFLLLL